MATVKELKELGVPFVRGDKYIHSGGEVEREADGMTLGWFHAGSVSALSAVITHFTWRPLNTLPDNPRFKYEQDFSQAEIRWRPLLEQPKVIKSLGELRSKLKSLSGEFKHYEDDEIATPKPVFTQEVADIKVGFKLKFNHDINGKFKRLHDERYGWEDGDNLEVIHITKNHDGEVCFIVLNCQEDVLTTAAIIDTSFFDTRTPKQKAVDEMFDLWCGSGRSAKDSMEAIYDAGYRKQ